MHPKKLPVEFSFLCATGAAADADAGDEEGSHSRFQLLPLLLECEMIDRLGTEWARRPHEPEMARKVIRLLLHCLALQLQCLMERSMEKPKNLN